MLHKLEAIDLDLLRVWQLLGGQRTMPDEQAITKIRKAEEKVLQVVMPRYHFKQFSLLPEMGNKLLLLSGVFEGHDIKKHLSGSEAVVFIATTLGAELDRLIRRASVSDIEQAVLLDAISSTLVEQYAKATQQVVAKNFQLQQWYSTQTFAPGYGDLPIYVQKSIVELLDTQRKIGLGVTQESLLIPTKSLTGIIGLARQPVVGRKTGCGNCFLHGKCDFVEGNICFGEEHFE